jgi:hypothetical protein
MRIAEVLRARVVVGLALAVVLGQATLLALGDVAGSSAQTSAQAEATEPAAGTAAQGEVTEPAVEAPAQSEATEPPLEALDYEEDTEPALDWPRQIDHPKAKIILYQPQAEGFGGDRLSGIMAVSVTPTGQTEPVFGAVRLSVRVVTDRDTRRVDIVDLEVTEVLFTEATDEQKRKLVEVIEASMPESNITISLDRFLTIIDAVEREQRLGEQLQADPPKIIFANTPAVLVSIDGEPRLRQIENTELRRVVNTPFFIALAPETSSYYLYGEDIWFAAKKVEGPWIATRELPTSIVMYAGLEVGAESAGTATSAWAPQIIVATEPTELIVTDGELDYVPTADGDLMYVENTQGDVFVEVATETFYVLLSGRWFKSSSLNGPWTHVPPDQLPDSFREIPLDTPKEHVRAHVSGTDEAHEAVLETYIPQTTAIKRSEASLEVEYDGRPRFEKIETAGVEDQAGPGMDEAQEDESAGMGDVLGPDIAYYRQRGAARMAGPEVRYYGDYAAGEAAAPEIQYAVNTDAQVLLIDGAYYACEEGVWFVSDNPTGPWVVADSVPRAALDSIPPSSPVYNTKYVHVYDSTPEVVYAGYTPGYVGSYEYGGTVVYGTGYYYRPWVGARYYARPVTWGYRAWYNPWTGNWGYRWGRGWTSGVYYGSGWFGWSTRWGVPGYARRGWWGVGGYRNVDVDARRNINVSASRNNIYRRSASVGRHTAGGHRSVGVRPARHASGLRNNVYADRSGNVHRRTAGGWQTRGRSGWGNTRSTAPSYGRGGRTGRSGYGGRSGMSRQHYARGRGSARSAGYARRGGARGGGGARRGGGRRR